jgi:thioredoxin 1
MATMHKFTDDNFLADVVETSRERPVLVDFTATWCGPCKMLAPIVETLNNEWNGSVSVGKLDIDDNVQTTSNYGVLGVPTLILFKDGQPVERLMGYVPKDRILSKLKSHL